MLSVLILKATDLRQDPLRPLNQKLRVASDCWRDIYVPIVNQGVHRIIYRLVVEAISIRKVKL